MSPTAPAPLVVKKGVCYALYAYDVGLSIDLEQCKRQIASWMQDAKIRQNRRAPKYFDYRPAPQLITRDIIPCSIGSYKTTADVDMLLYDFGGISVSYEIPFNGSLDELRAISCELSESSVLLNDSRKRVEDLLRAIGGAVAKPRLADLTEDYVVFQIDEYDSPVHPQELHTHYSQEFAQILRAEPQTLSAQEVADALACRISFAEDDVALIDWNGALIFDREAEDVRAVLEFANMELLEMRYLDHQLDDSLDRSYEVISSAHWWQKIIPGKSGGTLRTVSRMQVDGAILFERVSNAPKLLGDQYLARVYRLASQRFHLAEWNASALRKLEAIESIYKQIQGRAASWRLEALEWIIIILILLELVVPVVGKRWLGN
ncbi:MAG: hypothetical protein V1873_06200 [Verrucomicrobiota bacterium]